MKRLLKAFFPWLVFALIIPSFAFGWGEVTRPQLAGTDTGYGADLVGNGVRRVETLAELKTLDVDNIKPRTVYLSDRGGGLWVWDSSNLSVQVAADPQSGLYASGDSGASGAWKRIYSGALYAAWFGAIPDDGLDDTTAINAAIAVAGSAEKTLYVSSGVYRLVGSPGSVVVDLGSYDNWSLVGLGDVVFSFTDHTWGQHNLETSALIRGSGSLGVSAALSANVSQGENSLSVVSASGFAAGDVVMLSDDSTYDDAQPVKKGELLVIKSISGSTVEFDQMIDDDYTTANLAQIQLVNMVENVTLENIHLVGIGRNSVATADGDWGIQLKYYRNSKIINCSAENVDERVFDFTHSLDSVMAGLVVHFPEKGTNTDIQYGLILTGACRGCVVRDSRVYRGKHAYVTSHLQSDRGVPHDNLFVGNQAAGTWDSGFALHESAINTRFERNTATSCYGGFDIRQRGSKVLQNEIYGSTDTAILIRENPQDIVISGNVISGTGAAQNSIWLTDLTTASVIPDNVEISYNRVDGGLIGINIDDDAETATLRTGYRLIGNDIRNTANDGFFIVGRIAAVIADNSLVNIGDYGIYAEGLRYSQISGNRFLNLADDPIDMRDLGGVVSDYNVISDNVMAGYVGFPVNLNGLTGTNNVNRNNDDLGASTPN